MTRPRSFGLLVGLALFTVVISAAAVAGAQTDTSAASKSIVVRDAVDGKVSVTVDDSALNLVLTLEPGTATPVTRATVEVDRLRIPGGTTSTPVTLELDGQPFDPNTTMLEVRGGTRRELALTAQLPAPGTYQGAVTFVVEGRRFTTLLEVEFDRPLLAVDEAKDGTVAVTVDAARITLPLKVTTAASVDQSGVVVEVGRLTIPGTTASADVGVTVGGSALDRTNPVITVPAGVGQTLTLTADLPRPGVYEGAIVLHQAGSRFRTALKVTFGDPPLPTVAADPVGLVRGRTFDVTLRENGHRPVVLDAPSLVNVKKVLTTQVDESVVPSLVMFRVLGPDGRPRDIGQAVNLKADSELTFRVTVEGLDEPGSYKADVRFTVGGAQRGITAPITLMRRRSLWAAFGLLVLGVGVADGVRRLVLVTRPRLSTQLVVARWSERLRWVLDGLPRDERAQPDVAAATEAIQRQVAELAARANEGDLPETEVTSATSTYADRLQFLPRWAAAVADATEAGVLADADADVITTRDFVGFGTGTVDDANGALGRLRERARHGLTVSAVADLVGHLTERKAQVPMGLESRLAEAETSARKAQTDLAGGKFAEARQAYDAARELWANGLCEVARDKISVSPPLGSADERWDDLRKRTNAALANPVDPGEVEKLLEPMFVHYGRRVAELIGAEYPKGDLADDKLPADRNKAPDAQSKKRALDDAVAELWSAVEERDGTESLLRAETAITRLNDLAAVLKPGGTLVSMGMRAASGSEDRDTGPGLEIAGGLTVAGERSVRDAPGRSFTPPSAKSVRDRLRWLDLLVTAFAALGTVALGLLLIYGDNLAWGSENDMLTLFLWGLGIHQAAGVTGSIAVRKAVRGGLDSAPG